jgi:hypothetical protein
MKVSTLKSFIFRTEVQNMLIFNYPSLKAGVKQIIKKNRALA